MKNNRRCKRVNDPWGYKNPTNGGVTRYQWRVGNEDDEFHDHIGFLDKTKGIEQQWRPFVFTKRNVAKMRK